jgi:hypothetical protein
VLGGYEGVSNEVLLGVLRGSVGVLRGTVRYTRGSCGVLKRPRETLGVLKLYSGYSSGTQAVLRGNYRCTRVLTGSSGGTQGVL